MYGIPTLELEPKTKTKRMGIANTSSTVLGILKLVIRKKRGTQRRYCDFILFSIFEVPYQNPRGRGDMESARICFSRRAFATGE